ncbi:MAG: hypothetical protein R3B47_15420 [Bacteroidia bacterium]
MNIDFVYTILIISVITIVYSWQGGMKAVVWGDAIQMIILFAGLVICFFVGGICCRMPAAWPPPLIRKG